MTQLDIAAVPVRSDRAREMLWAYFAEVASRYYGRTATDAELDAAMAEDLSDVLLPPLGVFLLAREGTELVGAPGCG